MRPLRWIIGCLCCAVLWSCERGIEEVPLPITRCADAPVALTASACFTAQGKGYVFAGRDTAGKATNHLFCYDPATDQWSDLGATPLKERVRPRAVVAGEEVYMGLGFNGHVLIDTAYPDDWWRWSPATNTWTELSPYPSDRTVGPVVSTDGEAVYAVFGGKQNFERWIFRYDIAADQWTQLKDGLARMAIYPPRSHSACGGICGGRLFAGSGYTRDESSDFWAEAEIANDSVIWHRRSPMRGKRHNAVSTSDSEYIYVAGGHYYGGTVTDVKLYDDVLRYDVAKDRWQCIAHLPQARENMVCWRIGKTLFVGLGNDERNQPCNQLYRIEL